MNVAAVKHIIDRLRPSFLEDGHDLVFIDVTPDNEVRVNVCGHCQGGSCGASKVIMGLEVERALKRKIPEVKSVLVVSKEQVIAEGWAHEETRGLPLVFNN
jgi:Fe-S cluster biogenesis protein NfuA